jgi:hypothetical protein
MIKAASLAGAFLALAAAHHHAHADTFFVTNFSDAQPAPVGSFRAALQASNTTPLTAGMPHEIDVITAAAGTINPVAPFFVFQDVRILGHDKLTFNSTTAASNPIDGYTVMEVPSGEHLEVRNTNFVGRLRQRAIYVGPAGYLETRSVRITGFKQPENHELGVGGGVLCEGHGAGTPFGPLTTDCSLRRTRVDNCAADLGGGVAALGAVSLTLEHSDVSFNSADEDGGGVLMFGNDTADFESWFAIDKSSVRRNSAGRDAGGLVVLGVSYAAIRNTTFAQNSTAWQHRPGSVTLESIPDLRVLHSTIVDGSGPPGALSNGNALHIGFSTGYVRNSIIGQTGGPRGNLCTFAPGNAVTFANDIVGDATCGPAATPGLGLQGLQQVACTYPAPSLGGCILHPLLSTSAARNFADAMYCTAGHGTNRDQREYLRPGTCDAGAYEYDGVP